MAIRRIVLRGQTILDIIRDYTGDLIPANAKFVALMRNKDGRMGVKVKSPDLKPGTNIVQTDFDISQQYAVGSTKSDG